MELATKDDIIQLETEINRKFKQLSELILSNNSKTILLSIKDVAEEYNQSAYIQRLARRSGHLNYVSGRKEIQYQRTDVEHWISSRKIQ